MKRCLACQHLFPAASDACTRCRWTPPTRDALPAYAPALSDASEGFRATHFAELAALESDSFWFRARNRLILWSLRRYCPGFASFLEVGCGTGYVLAAIAQAFPRVNLSGSEIFSAGLAFAASRQNAARFIQMDARDIPFVEEFDAIGMFDVLEHIKEDELVLQQARNALAPRGTLLLTVPQHAWLWSATDEYACHVRRYAASDLHAKLRDAGFEIVRSTSFVSFLLPAMMAARLSKKGKKQAADEGAELSMPSWLNRLFENILAVETGLIRAGLNFPVGGSRLVIARKL
ncbi:class I SAM-dependent methyltransferase [Caballeronia sp. LZ065]|uniref:class I SAM-dependent methyltransferase n=1 Tax=Caballeronia sp. LZ065 TaxID=3038571 RepID=UPI00286636EA|nr:class I SAM-dependent methyltransferase [Caballeronia sp. LZ065]MDR5779076.1 class I SAM-dependent methyltransferase [Caballeronia sp. LZ065]